MNTNGHIDLTKLSESVQTISCIENLVNYRNMTSDFEELEDYFRKINFEHDNCLDYKESINTIYNELDYIKRKINELVESLRRTYSSFSTIDEFSSNDLKELSEIYKTTTSSTSLARLAKETASTSFKINYSGDRNTTYIPTAEPSVSKTSEPINTLPIGIAIGATGIAGSVGAVIVDDIYSKKNKKQKKAKTKDDFEIEDYVSDVLPEDDNYPVVVPEENHPYRAARMARSTDYFNEERFKDIDLDDNESEDLDDFYE